ncbi:MAG: hypothetical protein CMP49_05050 [Flavobacteriales bacterium]|nr:hypothetical protein [Flavobacteriales bacterium]|tara:strand:+ start:376 stop:1572 length:1197 start_codon:yes stop_codon:yes gene_type:complete
MLIHYFSHLIICLLFVFTLFSCQNEESLIGDNIINNGKYIVENYDGDIDMKITSEIDDSVSALGLKSLLGSYLDPYFGQTNAAFSFQVKLPANSMNFNAQNIENIFLNIPYENFYGETNLNSSSIEFIINVHQLNENIVNIDTTANATNFLSSLIYSTTTQLYDIQSNNSLQINLTETGFGLNEILNLNPADLENNESFLNAFNGFKLDVSPVTSTNGGIMYFDTASDSAFLQIEYVNLEGIIDTVNFEIGSQKKLNYFTHDYANSAVINDSTLFLLQSMGGVMSTIEIEGLNSLHNEGYIAVNNAELTISVDEENGSFPLPNALLIDAETNTGAVLDSINNTYTFNISNLITDIINSEEEDALQLKLYTAYNNSNADRVLLNKSNINLELILIKENN